MGQADIAMYRAKAQGKGRYHLFDPDDVIDNEAATGRVAEGASRRRPVVPQARRGPDGPRAGTRIRLEAAMEIPLFPLHQVLCPGIVLPLHIFEDRYQAMTQHCLDTGAAIRRRPDP